MRQRERQQTKNTTTADIFIIHLGGFNKNVDYQTIQTAWYTIPDLRFNDCQYRDSFNTTDKGVKQSIHGRRLIRPSISLVKYGFVHLKCERISLTKQNIETYVQKKQPNTTLNKDT